MRWQVTMALLFGIVGCSPAPLPGVCDSSADCAGERICQVGRCVDLRPMPDTGVTECTLFGPCPQALAPGQDAEYGPNTKDFETLAGGQVIRDQRSTLVWQRGSAPGLLGHAAAIRYCEALTLDGLRGWRLPDTWELYTLIDFSLPGPMISTGLEDTNLELPYWSIDRSGAEGRATLVSFQDGRLVRSLPGGLASVRCVHGATPVRPTGLESAAGQAPWRDLSTGLEWSDRMPVPGRWEHALTHCQWLELEGPGWRLPNILELLTLVDHDTETAVYWIEPELEASRWWWGASTPQAGEFGRSWSVHLGTGAVEPWSWMGDGRPSYRCVRDL